MDKRDLLLNALKAYKTDFDLERSQVQETINFIKQDPNCFERNNSSGHVSGGAWLLSPDGKKVLLTHHKKLGIWLHLGGHSDGDPDTWHVAFREATEESGIQGIQFISRDIFDVNVATIPEYPKANEPEHKHYDIRFMLRAPTEDFVVSDESDSLKWVDKKELAKMADNGELTKAMIRMMKKWQSE